MDIRNVMDAFPLPQNIKTMDNHSYIGFLRSKNNSDEDILKNTYGIQREPSLINVTDPYITRTDVESFHFTIDKNHPVGKYIQKVVLTPSIQIDIENKTLCGASFAVDPSCPVLDMIKSPEELCAGVSMYRLKPSGEIKELVKVFHENPTTGWRYLSAVLNKKLKVKDFSRDITEEEMLDKEPDYLYQIPRKGFSFIICSSLKKGVNETTEEFYLVIRSHDYFSVHDFYNKLKLSSHVTVNDLFTSETWKTSYESVIHNNRVARNVLAFVLAKYLKYECDAPVKEYSYTWSTKTITGYEPASELLYNHFVKMKGQELEGVGNWEMQEKTPPHPNMNPSLKSEAPKIEGPPEEEEEGFEGEIPQKEPYEQTADYGGFEESFGGVSVHEDYPPEEYEREENPDEESIEKEFIPIEVPKEKDIFVFYSMTFCVKNHPYEVPFLITPRKGYLIFNEMNEQTLGNKEMLFTFPMSLPKKYANNSYFYEENNGDAFDSKGFYFGKYTFHHDLVTEKENYITSLLDVKTKKVFIEVLKGFLLKDHKGFDNPDLYTSHVGILSSVIVTNGTSLRELYILFKQEKDPLMKIDVVSITCLVHDSVS